MQQGNSAPTASPSEALYQPGLGGVHVDPVTEINHALLKSVEKSVYLRSTLSQNAIIDDEIPRRTAHASCALGMPSHHLWNERAVKRSTKLSSYRAIMLAILLCGCESRITCHCSICAVFSLFAGSNGGTIFPISKSFILVGCPAFKPMLIKAQLCCSGLSFVQPTQAHPGWIL